MTKIVYTDLVQGTVQCKLKQDWSLWVLVEGKVHRYVMLPLIQRHLSNNTHQVKLVEAAYYVLPNMTMPISNLFF